MRRYSLFRIRTLCNCVNRILAYNSIVYRSKSTIPEKKTKNHTVFVTCIKKNTKALRNFIHRLLVEEIFIYN